MTLNLLVTTNARKAYLDNFVTHPDFRHIGVGSALWQGMKEWSEMQNVRLLDFLSGKEDERKQAHAFYEHRGVEVMESLSAFRLWMEG
jgi:GNAT superfamily N-acetyltransferase